MFIELTDHLACPAPHQEQFLVLLPERMEGRLVASGDLGCPVCGRIFRVEEGIADFGDGRPSDGRTELTAEALEAFFGLSGPGGYLALAGGVTSLAEELAARIPGVRLVLVNPPEDAGDSERASVLRAPRLPLKTGSMRGIAIGADLALDPAWIADAARAVLPGLRLVAEGGDPAESDIEVLGRVGDIWVGKAAR
ncbi:MAG TPA: Trm112 family protein [Gemmatimonadales bacterium]|nr:Trm112 family protein [Gemmatimonadales bacterium]